VAAVNIAIVDARSDMILFMGVVNEL